MRRSRQGLAPTPTGSSTTGCPRRTASQPQSLQTSKRSSSGVPVLSTVADAAAVISAISWGAQAIMGLAPTARARFAQSLAVTRLHDTVDQRALAPQSLQRANIQHGSPLL